MQWNVVLLGTALGTFYFRTLPEPLASASAALALASLGWLARSGRGRRA